MRLHSGAVVVALLLCGAVNFSASQSDCFANPADAACATFTVNSSEIGEDLDSACKAGSGWPSACSLRSICRSGDAQSEFCQPLSILLTGCAEQPAFSQLCSQYTKLCSAQSKVAACQAGSPLLMVPPADSLYQEAQIMCAQMDMAGCNTCAPKSQPGVVSAQSLQARCPDPLTSVSVLCRDMFMPGCAGWDKFCIQNGNNAGFPTLCNSNAVPTTSGGNTTSAPVSGSQPDCIGDPSQEACVDYKIPDARAIAYVEELCDSMSSMVGCTLEKTCKNGFASGPRCSPFSLLADLCVDMPTMTGCEDYVAICSANNTVVAQCKDQPPISNILRTNQAIDSILNMCSSHSMPGCKDCTSRSKCIDPMTTISKLCLEMPGMPQCAQFAAMCEEAGDSFTTLCKADDNGMPVMKMYLHARMSEMILIKEWVADTNASYIGSCLAVMAAAVLVQALKGWRVRQEALWAMRRRAVCCSPDCTDPLKDGSEQATSHSSFQPPDVDDDVEAPCCGSNNNNNNHRHRNSSAAAAEEVQTSSSNAITSLRGPSFNDKSQSRYSHLDPSSNLWSRNSVRAAFTMVVVFLDYMLMLIVMTFNIGIIVSAVIGFGIGALLFGHMGEGNGGQVAVVAGEIAPDSENDLEVQFVDPQTCCNSRHM